MYDTTGTSDTTIQLDGKDTAIKFKDLKYQGGTAGSLVAKTSALYGANLTSTSTPLAAFEVVAVLGSVNPIGTGSTNTAYNECGGVQRYGWGSQ
jgi:hypothetical protein